MSWKAIPNGSEVDLVGPVGDTLEVEVSSTGDDYAWNGWSWTGQVRATPSSSSTVGTFTFTDTSTSTTLALLAKVSATTTDDWTPGDTLVYAIQGTKSGTVVTFVQGRIIPTDSIVR
jgi:hypothetical protein